MKLLKKVLFIALIIVAIVATVLLAMYLMDLLTKFFEFAGIENSSARFTKEDFYTFFPKE